MINRNGVILVTGGAGFIGSHVVVQLVRSGFQVVNLDLLTYAGNLDNLTAVSGAPGHRFIRGNICDGRIVADILSTHRPDVILNIAAESHVDRSIDSAAVFMKTNVEGTFVLLDAALAYWRSLPSERQDNFRFIQMSTDEVYGSISEGTFTEGSNYAPNSPYAASKAAGDHLVRSYNVTYRLPTVIVHASNTYGPRQYPEKLIPHMILAALDGRRLPVYGEGKNVRDWMYVGDLADGLERVVVSGRPGETYNFAGCDERQNIDTVRMICTQLRRLTSAERSFEDGISYVTDRPGHDFRYAMSIDKVERELKWAPKMKFDDGLEETVGWYLANREWCASVLTRGYDGGRIGTNK